MGEPSRDPFRVWLVGFLGVLSVLVLTGWSGYAATAAREPTTTVLQSVTDDVGDGRATTTHDGAMVRRRTAIGIRPVAGADRELIRQRLRSVAVREDVGPLSDATFAVFSAELLTYLVPEVVVVLPEGASVQDAEILMRDHRHPGVAFHLVESVLVHDLTFAVIPSGVSAADVRDRADREGVLSDSLGHYRTEVQSAGLAVRYFGALLSDGQVLAVREAIARAAHVAPDRVFVTASSSGGGVDMSAEPVQRSSHHP